MGVSVRLLKPIQTLFRQVRFPAPVEDAYAALLWVAQGGFPWVVEGQ